jgi:hypothetical protein
MTRATIVRAYVRHYSDNGQSLAYVEWSDGSRTEGDQHNTHMQALLRHAVRLGRFAGFETW